MRLQGMLTVIQQMSMARNNMLSSSQDVFLIFMRPATDAMNY